MVNERSPRPTCPASVCPSGLPGPAIQSGVRLLDRLRKNPRRGEW